MRVYKPQRPWLTLLLIFIGPERQLAWEAPEAWAQARSRASGAPGDDSHCTTCT
jgi:hypothetical protein